MKKQLFGNSEQLLRLIAAMALYRKIGYEIIPNYGQYKDMEDSVCMRKKI